MSGIVLQTTTKFARSWVAYWDGFWALPAVGRAAALVAATVALALVLVGLFPEYGVRGATKARRHSVTTTFLGALVTGIFVGSVGALWYGATRNDVFSMLALPVLFVLISVAVVWTGIGLVALGNFVAARGGHDDAVWGIVAMAVLVGVGGFYPAFGAVVLAVAALLGFGAGVRTNPFAAVGEERVIPPDRKI
jgi:hypothetical protein